LVLKGRLEEIISPVVEGLGFDFWGVEFQASGKSSCLRIYIDSEKGVGVEDCAAVSRQVSAVLDVEDPIAERYSLEVSSPGLERPLFKLSQYEQFIGESIYLALIVPVGKRRRFKAVLDRIEDNKLILIHESGDVFRVPVHQIRNAHLIYDH